jgi:hypothetical protein
MLQQRSAYTSPVHAVERIRIRARLRRSRPDFVVLYLLAAIAGMFSGFALSVVA